MSFAYLTHDFSAVIALAAVHHALRLGVDNTVDKVVKFRCQRQLFVNRNPSYELVDTLNIIE